MFDVHKVEIEWGGRPLVMETGRVARQADGAVLISYGESTVLCTATAQRTAREGVDFMPLTCDYQEKTFAAGKIPGGFFKREGRPTEKETLTSRLIDRPIRPLFHKRYHNETQVIATVVSHDLENNPDIVAMIGASAALTISGIPFLGPIAACRVGFVDGEYVLNPLMSDLPDSDLELIVAGTRDGVLMVESQASELTEAQMLGAVTFGHEQFQPVIDAIIQLAEKCAKEPWALTEAPPEEESLREAVRIKAEPGFRTAYNERVKQDRQEKLAAVRDEVKEAYAEDEVASTIVPGLLKELESDIVRGAILQTGERIDGRSTTDIRPIVCDVGMLPRAHGSALFTRGETQAMVVATLGTGQDEQIVDALEGEYREYFLLHYNFPPYSVGEVKFLRSPGRREIGHGKLAWRAVRPLLPGREDFPYTMRVVSEITESNGSSSMATVCGTSLALMDAGVPLERPVAGIAMGLIKEGESFAVLSDILGDEDHLGDMDFKVAGTEQGITSLQMDLKITSITAEIMQVALDQAKAGRLHILGEMGRALGTSRDSISQHAPRISTMAIPKDKIRDVIGTGGKVIREICEETGAKIDIEDDGTVRVASADEAAAQKAIDWIKGIVAEPEVGVIYTGKVVKTLDFGAFVNFLGSRDGLVHISELKPERVGRVTDVVNEGDEVKVKVVGFDERGKVRLSMKVVDQETGEDMSEQMGITAGEGDGQRPPRPPREGRDGDRRPRGRQRHRA
jgi:polyribonucleotide nucleotidyltransferase